MNTTATNPSDNDMSTDTQLRWVDGIASQSTECGRYIVWWASARWQAAEHQENAKPFASRSTREAAKEACERHHQSQLSA